MDNNAEFLNDVCILMKHDLNVMREALRYYRNVYVIEGQSCWREPEVMETAQRVSQSFKWFDEYLEKHAVFLTGLLANNKEILEREIQAISFIRSQIKEASGLSYHIERVINSIRRQPDDNKAKQALDQTAGETGRKCYEQIVGNSTEGTE